MERDQSVILVGVLLGVVLFFNFMADHHPQMMADINPSKERIVIHNGLEHVVVITHLSKSFSLKPGETVAKRFPLGHVLTVNVLKEGKVIGTTYYRVPDRYYDDLPWHITSYEPLRR